MEETYYRPFRFFDVGMSVNDGPLQYSEKDVVSRSISPQTWDANAHVYLFSRPKSEFMWDGVFYLFAMYAGVSCFSLL